MILQVSGWLFAFWGFGDGTIVDLRGIIEFWKTSLKRRLIRNLTIPPS